MHQRILAPMRNPHGLGPGGADGAGQFIPVGMIGNYQRQFDPALLGTLLDCHPAGCLTYHRIGQAARPAIPQG